MTTSTWCWCCPVWATRGFGPCSVLSWTAHVSPITSLLPGPLLLVGASDFDRDLHPDLLLAGSEHRHRQRHVDGGSDEREGPVNRTAGYQRPHLAAPRRPGATTSSVQRRSVAPRATSDIARRPEREAHRRTRCWEPTATVRPDDSGLWPPIQAGRPPAVSAAVASERRSRLL